MSQIVAIRVCSILFFFQGCLYRVSNIFCAYFLVLDSVQINDYPEIMLLIVSKIDQVLYRNVI